MDNNIDKKANEPNNSDLKYIQSLEDWINKRKKDNDYSIEQFDKLIVYLSSGGLVLTTGFVSNIIKITEETNTILLKLSWIGFTVSLIFILVSQITSFKANLIEIERTRLEIDSIKKQVTVNISRWLKTKLKIFNSSTLVLNNLSLLFLLIGICLFVIFMTKNI